MYLPSYHSDSSLVTASKENPCPHCGKPDWCYSIGELSVCNRENPAEGWTATTKTDSEGKLYYAPAQEPKEVCPAQARKPKAKKKEYPHAPIPIGAKLLKLAAPQSGPEPFNPLYIPKGVPVEAQQVTYAYSASQEVFRYQWVDLSNPKGRDKTCRQTHVADDGKQIWTKGDSPWSAYGIEEVVETLKSIPDDKPVAVLMLEGEPNVELARWSNSLAALTMQGSNWSHPEIQLALERLRATGKNVVLVKLRDNDDSGIKKGNEVWLVARHNHFPCVIDPVAIYPEIPDKGDIREILENMDIEEFIRRLEAEIHNAATEEINENSITPHTHTREDVVHKECVCSESYYIPDTPPVAEQNFVQKAEAALYSDGCWKSIGGLLYQFTGAYYEERPEKLEKRRIRDWLNTYSEKVKGVYVCNRAKSGSVDEIYNWVVLGRAVNIKEVNPPGLNCSNGVVIVNRDGSHTLVPHSPDKTYTYVGCKYDPDIDTTDCDRLLECLEPQQREIFMRTVAASLCLPLARLKMSRVKGLLCHGDGSNGKDTLRTVLVKVLGRGVTGKTLKDFQIYDSGRKFPLAGKREFSVQLVKRELGCNETRQTAKS